MVLLRPDNASRAAGRPRTGALSDLPGRAGYPASINSGVNRYTQWKTVTWAMARPGVIAVRPSVSTSATDDSQPTSKATVGAVS